jgi:hypothetical protein
VCVCWINDIYEMYECWIYFCGATLMPNHEYVHLRVNSGQNGGVKLLQPLLPRKQLTNLICRKMFATKNKSGEIV